MDKQVSKFTIRPMIDADIDRVMEMEKVAFSDPWPRTAFVEQLKGPYWGAIVAEEDGTIVGYACYLIVADESHLTNIAVDPAWRRKSVAKLLLDRILQIVAEFDCTLILLEVRPSNVEAISFYEKYDFELLYRRPNYYRRPIEDALVMVRHLTDDKDLK
jgi:ribosomal-protein-alanine N-acetyltransferase